MSYPVLKLTIILFVGIVINSCQSNKKAAVISPSQTNGVNHKTILGTWGYTLNIRPFVSSKEDILNPNKENSVYTKPKGLKASNFSITIEETHISWGNNEVECNSCDKRYELQENKIIFSEKKQSATCTELDCLRKYELKAIDNEGKLTYIFVDMNYKIENDTLFLESDAGQKLKLIRTN